MLGPVPDGRRPARDRAVMKQLIEREVKLDIGPSFRLPRLPGRPLAPRVFVSTYVESWPKVRRRAARLGAEPNRATT
jgi:hypothetical protein